MGLINIIQFTDEIIQFIIEHAAIKKREQVMIAEFLENLINWRERGDETYMNIHDETSVTIKNYLTNAIFYLENVFPSIIIHETNYKNIPIIKKIPKHWHLSTVHQGHLKKIIDSEFETLSPFFEKSNLNDMLITEGHAVEYHGGKR